jgi:hypothetical protein
MSQVLGGFAFPSSARCENPCSSLRDVRDIVGGDADETVSHASCADDPVETVAHCEGEEIADETVSQAICADGPAETVAHFECDDIVGDEIASMVAVEGEAIYEVAIGNYHDCSGRRAAIWQTGRHGP